MMVNYSSPSTRQAARLIPWVCALFFACFSFCYLYFYQPGYLAQLQYHFSHGETTYQPLVGAVLITLPLLLLGLFLHRLVRWPVRCCALAWFPPAFLLAAVTAMRMPELPGFTTCMPWGTLFFMLVLYALAVCLCCLHPDATGERSSLSSYLSGNLLILCCLLFMTGTIGYSSAPGHRELRMGRLLHQHRYDQAVHCCTDTAGLTHRLFALRAAALASSGLLGDSLFLFPVPQGTSTLMPDPSDSLFVYDALPHLYRGMRAVPRNAASYDESLFLTRALQADSLPRPMALDYLLCHHLLVGHLEQFYRMLAFHSDSLTVSLPQHYREALVLCQVEGIAGIVPSQAPLRSLPGSTARLLLSSAGQPLCYDDSVTVREYQSYSRLRASASNGDRQAADSLQDYSGTYWAYYYARCK